ncbi:GSH-dependent disulfide bond oxidoreductase [Salmonella enterica subsp. salamae]|uniref:GSH-dependent disulfide bond oxidoreductase n=2 Tax=Salmonella enterica TaxID=28901 RepID=A0A8F7YKK4_SALER|nr:GSH-dependent disulfide bond oxidoreductase [Salmonella enterica]EAA4081748.1 GSH-dependent disulfide bond oxidoreductase [Salmonella enterica subsp. salamae serovar Sofia]EBP3975969.1 GSH-dependent disulfide bond oxidoreductase [Salmonella enterica subsp. enterica]ECI2507818.1 GSH-dependent disulfide bond oxidoreductase [Salmonella enterica subsp. enterica serovar Paratyphi B]EDS8303383.1 GSH-dependent disulfide bond oxidoreductase [Salmonella enterica subsp. enterica serovar Java]EDT74980
MIDLYYAPTPNGHKITLFLEEAELAYRLLKVDISKGNQFRPDFLAISPNNKIPAIVDHAPTDGGQPLSLFESGEILLYLAEKSGKLLSGELRERHTTLQWLFWQVGGLGPMLGQNHHFNHFAPQTIPYAIERYQVETQRLYNVLNKRLEASPWLGGDHYSIADIASWPWVNAHQRQRIDLDTYPAVYNWFERIRTRPATARAMLQAQLHCNSTKE